MQNTMRFSELHCREVINLCDGARMGEVSDLLFDPVCGQITALVVPAQSGIAGLFSKNDCVIPWGCIETLGEDYILVRYRRNNAGLNIERAGHSGVPRPAEKANHIKYKKKADNCPPQLVEKSNIRFLYSRGGFSIEFA